MQGVDNPPWQFILRACRAVLMRLVRITWVAVAVGGCAVK